MIETSVAESVGFPVLHRELASIIDLTPWWSRGNAVAVDAARGSVAGMLKPGKFEPKTIGRAVRFLVVGGGSALVQIVILGGLVGHVHDRVAFVLSWIASTMTHYLANRFWALPSARSDTRKQLGEYLFATGVSLFIQWAVFELFYAAMGLDAMWSTVLAIPPSTVVVFLILNYRVFRARGA